MRALLICPAERPAVAALGREAPLANLQVLGRELIVHWLQHLAALGAKKIIVLAADRPGQVRALAGDGTRWGIEVEVIPERRELSAEEARAKYHRAGEAWLGKPHDITLLDHLPGRADFDLFHSYGAFFAGVRDWLPCAPGDDRIGLREIKPGVWVGLHARIGARARLMAPCWIGDDVSVAEDAAIGPNAYVERGAIIDRFAQVRDSFVAAGTYVGSLTEVHDSIAAGQALIDLGTNSVVEIADRFVLCALRGERRFRLGSIPGRVAALVALVVTAPYVALWVLHCTLEGADSVRRRRAVRPGAPALPQSKSSASCDQTAESILYYKLLHPNGWWQRWPQLWSIVIGDFKWIGNRPLSAAEAAGLRSESDRLWLAAPVGLVSQADAEGCVRKLSDEGRAHAIYYAATAGWRTDWAIVARLMKRLVAGRRSSWRREGAFKIPRLRTNPLR